MKYIILKDSEESLFIEHGNCRAIKNKKSPMHLCITGFTNGYARPPTKLEIDEIVNEFFLDNNEVVLPNIQIKMFSDDTIHIWEDTEFTRKLI